MANADLALQRGETDTALNVLRTISSEQPYFIQAKEKMAQIYLVHRKDKKMYAQCYRQIVEKSPTPQSYVLLGDAYMAIQVRTYHLNSYLKSQFSSALQNLPCVEYYYHYRQDVGRCRLQ